MFVVSRNVFTSNPRFPSKILQGSWPINIQFDFITQAYVACLILTCLPAVGSQRYKIVLQIALPFILSLLTSALLSFIMARGQRSQRGLAMGRQVRSTIRSVSTSAICSTSSIRSSRDPTPAATPAVSDSETLVSLSGRQTSTFREEVFHVDRLREMAVKHFEDDKAMPYWMHPNGEPKTDVEILGMYLLL